MTRIFGRVFTSCLIARDWRQQDFALQALASNFESFLQTFKQEDLHYQFPGVLPPARPPSRPASASASPQERSRRFPWKDIWSAVCRAVAVALTSRFHQVLHSACILLTTVLGTIERDGGVGREFLQRETKQVLKGLVRCLADVNCRVRAMADGALRVLAKSLGPALLVPYLVNPAAVHSGPTVVIEGGAGLSSSSSSVPLVFGGSSSQALTRVRVPVGGGALEGFKAVSGGALLPRIALAHLHALQQAISDSAEVPGVDASRSSFSLPVLIAVVVEAGGHPNSQASSVRQAAADLGMTLFGLFGQTLLPFLSEAPPSVLRLLNDR
eukprot:Cvel_18502.t2-p1 / transcript=Cvel_18502.t2 / gene=Cvel_18502 / organism=Chromera_velia_CCMP2878 / gene_product=hypothetical protein / transcript_product=hypothetical protein / location=Cvel_scaffold1536:13927-17491(+) / protein_length=325 / sequence_SO=supercontig / SO=protein_coding / is_pseudo=false